MWMEVAGLFAEKAINTLTPVNWCHINMWIVGDLSAMNVLLLSVTSNVRGGWGEMFKFPRSPPPFTQAHIHQSCCFTRFFPFFFSSFFLLSLLSFLVIEEGEGVSYEELDLWNFPGNPVVKILPSSAGGVGSIPGRRLKYHTPRGPKK